METMLKQDKNGIPLSIKRWNWGAFLLNIVWCLRHGVWFGLWMFVPIINFVVPFILGMKGNEWAWKKNNYASETEFLKTQKKWGIWGLIIWSLTILLYASLFFFLTFTLNHSLDIQTVINTMNHNDRISEYLGTPIVKTGVQGSISFSKKNGREISSCQFDVTGSKREATVTAKLLKKNEKTVITHLSIEEPNHKKTIFISSAVESSQDEDAEPIL